MRRIQCTHVRLFLSVEFSPWWGPRAKRKGGGGKRVLADSPSSGWEVKRIPPPPFLGSMIPLRPPAREIDPSMIGYQGSGFGFGGSIGGAWKKEGEREKSSMEFALLQQRGEGVKRGLCVCMLGHIPGFCSIAACAYVLYICQHKGGICSGAFSFFGLPFRFFIPAAPPIDEG